MKRLLLSTLFTLFAVAAFAQKGTVTGTVVDAETGETVAGAVLEFSPAGAPDKKQYSTSGFKGAVSIPSLAYGEYKLVVSFLGYNNAETTFKVSAAKQDIGKIELRPGVQIETVVKEAKALRTSQKGDTVSYNAGAFKVTDDADVEGLLKKMPGITVSDGTVEAQGESVKKIFVDGKEFFGEDVTTAIKSLPAQAVDRIEVYNKLSDAAEFSGMDDGEGYKALNIVTRPGMRQGQFGKLYAGFGYDAVMGVAPAVIDAVKSGDIKRFILLAGCDGMRKERSYYTDFAKLAPSDSVILTLACGKYRFNDLDLGSIDGIPRLLDVGQCNDAYGAIKIALALADAFGCGVNDLPLSMVLSWYEQKAVCILLTLLHLGIKGIYLGPTLPAFVSPGVLQVLVDNYGIRPISTPEADLAQIMG